MGNREYVVVVTGAARGIGRAIAERFAEEGYIVIAADIHTARYESENIHYRRVDLCSVDDISNLFAFAQETFGTVHILVNNGAISHFNKSILDVTPDEFNKVIATNLTAAFLCSKEMVRVNSGELFGRIINISSTRYHQNESDWEAYGASKGGLISLTNSLCVSLSDRPITVNAISPGWIQCEDYDSLSEEDHKQHPSGRVGRADDISRLVLFLANKESDFINGANIIVDGGMTKKMIYQ